MLNKLTTFTYVNIINEINFQFFHVLENKIPCDYKNCKTDVENKNLKLTN